MGRQQEYQIRRLAEGKCRQCGKPKPDGVVLCKACRDKKNALYVRKGDPRGRPRKPQYEETL